MASETWFYGFWAVWCYLVFKGYGYLLALFSLLHAGSVLRSERRLSTPWEQLSLTSKENLLYMPGGVNRPLGQKGEDYFP